MTNNKYAFGKFNSELMARALGRDMAISTKQSIEIANHLRHRKLTQAKSLMEMVIKKKHAVPFKRFTDGVGHRPGKLASGRYPVKAAKAFLKLLESVEANAQTKGLNTSELEIIHICAHKAHSPVHYGRHSGREFKRSHIEIVVQETAGKKKDAKKENKKEVKKEPAKKAEAKPNAAAKPAELKKEEKQEVNKEEKKQDNKEEKPEEKAAESPSEDQK